MYYQKKNKKLRDNIFILFFIILLMLLSSKAMLLVMMIGALIFVISRGISWFGSMKKVLILGVAILVVGISSFSVIERIVVEGKAKYNEILSKEKFSKAYPWTGSSIRLLQLRIFKEQLKEETIFLKGFGLFASRNDLRKRHIDFNTFQGYHGYNYHNQYVQIFAESGIFGLILLLGMIAMIFIKTIKSRNYFGIMFLVSMCLIFFTESLLWRQKGLFLFVILYCLIIRTSMELEEIESNELTKGISM